ncbi:hypothetical protein AC140_37020 [Bacteroides fragilis]|nr:hypothetical protein AC140_37020 [Bacteroides fragilis]
MSGNRIVNATFGVDVILFTDNIRGSQDGGNLRIRAILQGIGSQYKTGINKLDVVIENGQFGGGTVFAPIRSQHVFFIHQGASIKIIAQIVQTVIIQTICQQGSIPVDHFYILTKLRYLGHAVIKQIITIDEKGIPLLHTHITECFERIGFLVNQGTVTIHVHAVMTQLDRTDQHLNIGAGQLIGLSLIGMKQVDTCFLFTLCLFRFNFLLRLRFLVMLRFLVLSHQKTYSKQA